VWTQKYVFIEHRKGSDKSSVGFYYLIGKKWSASKMQKVFERNLMWWGIYKWALCI